MSQVKSHVFNLSFPSRVSSHLFPVKFIKLVTLVDSSPDNLDLSTRL